MLRLSKMLKIHIKFKYRTFLQTKGDVWYAKYRNINDKDINRAQI